jgi:hypothetical protein
MLAAPRATSPLITRSVTPRQLHTYTSRRLGLPKQPVKSGSRPGYGAFVVVGAAVVLGVDPPSVILMPVT